MMFSHHRYHWRTLCIVLLATTGGCFNFGDCSNEVISDLKSPDGKRRAVVFQRNCGATMGFSTELSIVESGEEVTDGGNVFAADSDHGQAPPGPGGGPAVVAVWAGADTLVVRHHPRARVFRSDSIHAGVRVRYVRDSLP
jgi:hypothetical protein